MPDPTDLHDAFARLEQEIPDHYRSPIVQDRITDLIGDGPHSATDRRGLRHTRLAAGLLAAAAVVALAGGLALILGNVSDHNSRGQIVGTQPTSSRHSSRPPSSETSPSHHSSSTAVSDAMPATPTALVTYVQGAERVGTHRYERGSTGPGRPMDATPGIAEFTTPSGNIDCGISVATSQPDASCEVKQSTYHHPPKPATCTNNWAPSWLSLDRSGTTLGLCLGGPPFAPVSNTLPYGSTLRYGSVACRSESGFLACADVTTGHGFAVSRTAVRTY